VLRIPWGTFKRFRCFRSIRRLRVVGPFDFSVWRGPRPRPDPLLHPIVSRARSSPPPLPNPIPSNDDRSTNHSRTSYAFVEFRSTRDAEDAYNDMYVSNPRMSSPLGQLIVTSRHGRNLDGYRLSIQVRHLLSPPISQHSADMITQVG